MKLRPSYVIFTIFFVGLVCNLFSFFFEVSLLASWAIFDFAMLLCLAVSLFANCHNIERLKKTKENSRQSFMRKLNDKMFFGISYGCILYILSFNILQSFLPLKFSYFIRIPLEIGFAILLSHLIYLVFRHYAKELQDTKKIPR